MVYNYCALKSRMIVNPRAGVSLTQPDIQQAVRVLREAGWQLELATTEAGGHATELAKQAVEEGCQVVIACGGDGTINEVLQPLVGTEAILAVIPKGTVNAFAREVGLPRQPVAAAGALLTARARTLDVGQVDGRYFLLWAGVGFDAEVVRMVEAGRRPQLGILPFILPTIGAIITFDGVKTRIKLDGKPTQRTILMAVVSNAHRYALFELSPEARPDDGVLDLCLFTGSGLATKVLHIARFLLGRHLGSPGVHYCRVKEASFQPDTPLPVQVDGEFVGITPVTCRIVPQSLRVLLPTDVPAGGKGA